MGDELQGGLLTAKDVRVLAVVSTGISRAARDAHGLLATSGELLAQALTGAALLSGLQLQKQRSRINLQLECDGPLRGLFADCDAEGNVRGYVKNPFVEFHGG